MAAGPGAAEIVGAAFAFDSSEHDFCVPSVTVRTPAASATPAPRGGGHWALVTLCTILSLAAFGVWLFVLPLELLRLVSA